FAIELVAQCWKVAEDALEILAHLPVVAPVGAKQEVALDGHGAEEAAALRHVDHPTGDNHFRPETGQTPACQVHAPAGYADDARKRAQERRLPRAVGADQGDQLTRGELEIDAEEDRRHPEPGREL